MALLSLAAYWCGPAVVRYATDKGEQVIKIDNPPRDLTLQGDSNWKPRDDVRLQGLGADAAEKALRGLLGSEADPKGHLEQLRFEVAEFRRKHTGTPQALEAARLLERTPSPLDALNRNAISPYELAVAGNGDPKAAPMELTAVLGDSRFRHSGWIGFVLFSPDGKKLISSGGGVVKIWDAASAEVLQTIVCDGNSLYPAIGVEGWTLAVGVGSAVRFWDLQTGKEGRTLRGHTDLIYKVAFSHDGKTLASSSADGSVKLWDLATGEVRHTLKSREGWPYVFTFSADDKILTMTLEDRTKLTWDAVGGGEPSEANSGQVCLPSFDGKMTAAIYDKDFTVQVCNASTGKEIWRLRDLKFITRCAAFSRDGRLLATGGFSGELKIWDLDTGKILENLSYSDSCSIMGLAFSDDGRLLASAGDDRRIRLWDVTTRKENVFLKPGCGRLAAIGPDGCSLATLDINTVKILDMVTGQESQRLPASDFTGRLALSPDGRSLLSMRLRSGAILLWDLATAQAQPVGAHPRWPTALIVSADGALAASAASGPEVKLWNLATRRIVRTFTHIGPVLSLAFSPDGRTLAAATKDNVVKVWSTADGQERCTLLGRCVSFSPEGPLAAATGDTVTLYDPATWKELRTLHRTAAEPSEPFSLVFNPSGRLVAASNDDGKVDVWNLNDAKEQPRSFWVTRSMPSDGELAFTPEGRYLISANANGTVYVLRLTPTPEK